MVIIHEAQLSPLRVAEASIHKLRHKCSVRSTDVASIKQVVLGSCRNKIYIVSIQFPQNHDIESNNSNALFFSQWKIQKQHI